MDKQPQMLDFAKAMSDADRLRIIGVLAQRSARAAEVASELNIPPQDAFNHLEFLRFVGVVRREEGVYRLDSSGLEALSERQFAGERETYTPAPDLDKESRKVLTACLNPDGTIKQIPSQPARLKALLRYLVQAFTPGRNYTEKEVNTILRRFHIDVSGLRRDLIDSGLMARESNGSRYWRV